MTRSRIAQLKEAVEIARVMLRDAKDNRASPERIAVLRDRIDNAESNLADERERS